VNIFKLSAHGVCKVKEAPRVVGVNEDKLLMEAMKKAEMENKQVAGDSDNE